MRETEITDYCAFTCDIERHMNKHPLLVYPEKGVHFECECLAHKLNWGTVHNYACMYYTLCTIKYTGVYTYVCYIMVHTCNLQLDMHYMTRFTVVPLCKLCIAVSILLQPVPSLVPSPPYLQQH